MNVVSDEHKATLRQWHEELQEKRGLRASLRRSATLNDVCLSEGFHSLMVQTHSLWNTQGKAWRFTALALVAALAAQVKTIDDRQTFAAQLGQKTGDTPRAFTLYTLSGISSISGKSTSSQTVDSSGRTSNVTSVSRGHSVCEKTSSRQCSKKRASDRNCSFAKATESVRFFSCSWY